MKIHFFIARKTLTGFSIQVRNRFTKKMIAFKKMLGQNIKLFYWKYEHKFLNINLKIKAYLIPKGQWLANQIKSFGIKSVSQEYNAPGSYLLNRAGLKVNHLNPGVY